MSFQHQEVLDVNARRFQFVFPLDRSSPKLHFDLWMFVFNAFHRQLCFIPLMFNGIWSQTQASLLNNHLVYFLNITFISCWNLMKKKLYFETFKQWDCLNPSYSAIIFLSTWLASDENNTNCLYFYARWNKCYVIFLWKNLINSALFGNCKRIFSLSSWKVTQNRRWNIFGWHIHSKIKFMCFLAKTRKRFWNINKQKYRKTKFRRRRMSNFERKSHCILKCSLRYAIKSIIKRKKNFRDIQWEIKGNITTYNN